jgi:hypothetical protein
MIVLQPKPAGFFAQGRKNLRLFLFGAGIGAGTVALTVATILLLAWGGAKPAVMALQGEAVAGTDVLFEVDVKNGGVLNQKYKAVLLVDGEKTDEQVVTLQSKETVKVTLRASGLTAGTHVFAVGDIRQDIRVLRPAAFTVTGISVQPQNPLPGEDVTVTATVQNTGEVKGEYTAEFILDGKLADTGKVEVGPGGQQTATAKLKSVARGTHTVSLGGAEKGFAALAPAHIEVTGLTLSNDYAMPGQTVTATVSLENSGDLAATYTLQLLVGGAVEAQQDIFVTGGKKLTYTYDLSRPKEGSYDVQAGYFSRTLLVANISRPATNTLLVKKANGGSCSISVSNGFKDMDVIITLVSTSNPKAPLLSFYVRAGESSKKIKVKNGSYYVFYTVGTDYAPSYKKFLGDPYFLRSEEVLTCKTYKTYEGIYVYTHFTDFTLQLNVSGGNSQAITVSENDFPK